MAQARVLVPWVVGGEVASWFGFFQCGVLFIIHVQLVPGSITL